MLNRLSSAFVFPFIISVVGFASTFSLVGCTTVPKPTSSRKIIDWTPGVSEPPAWVSGKNRTKEGDKVAFKGFLQMEGDNNGANCSQAAGVAAKGRLVSEFVALVLDESGIAGDNRATVTNRLTATLSQTRLAGVEVADEFYQLVEIDDGRQAKRQLECFARVTIPEKTYDLLMRQAIDSLAANSDTAANAKRLEERQTQLRKSGGISE